MYTFVDATGSPLAPAPLNPSTELLRQKLGSRQRRPSAPFHEGSDELVPSCPPAPSSPQRAHPQPVPSDPSSGPARPSRQRRKFDDAARAALEVDEGPAASSPTAGPPGPAPRPIASAPAGAAAQPRARDRPPKPVAQAAPTTGAAAGGARPVAGAGRPVAPVAVPPAPPRAAGLLGDPRELDAAVDAAKAAKAALKERRRLELDDRRRELYAWNAALELQFRQAGTDHTGDVLDGV